jgi:RNA polymerase sigma factor (sigma-70 family)
VALNLARSRLRRIGAERRAKARLQGKQLFLSEPNPDASRDLADLRRAISRLPRRQREIVFLHYYMDLGLAESADLLGIGEGTVKKALHRARQTLATSLRETDETLEPEER